MREEDRLYFLKTINNAELKGYVDKEEMLDELIWEQYDCEHEYGIKKVNPNGKKAEYKCLDCGEAISEEQYQKLFNVPQKNYTLSIRARYLELLQSLSSEDSIKELKKEYGLRLIRKPNK